MKQQIPLSAISEIKDFEVAVAKHAFDLKEWKAHQDRVEQDNKNPPADPMLKHWPQKRPQAHPMVERAVDENGDVNFEVVDDTPKPEKLSLDQKKNLLRHDLAAARHAAIHVVLPWGKHNLFAMRQNEISARDIVRRDKLIEQNKGFFKKLTGKLMSGDEIMQAVDSSRPADDAAFLAEQMPRRQKIAAIEKLTAQASYDIEDLTEDIIDAWKIPDLSK